jgi:hypothetical protein
MEIFPGHRRADAGVHARHPENDSRFDAHLSYEDEDRSPPRERSGLVPVLNVLGLIMGLLLTYTVICAT